MEQEYNHLIEVHGRTEIGLIFGSLEGYIDVRHDSTYIEVSTEVDYLMSQVDSILELMIE